MSSQCPFLTERSHSLSSLHSTRGLRIVPPLSCGSYLAPGSSKASCCYGPLPSKVGICSLMLLTFPLLQTHPLDLDPLEYDRRPQLIFPFLRCLTCFCFLWQPRLAHLWKLCEHGPLQSFDLMAYLYKINSVVIIILKMLCNKETCKKSFHKSRKAKVNTF